MRLQSGNETRVQCVQLCSTSPWVVDSLAPSSGCTRPAAEQGTAGPPSEGTRRRHRSPRPRVPGRDAVRERERERERGERESKTKSHDIAVKPCLLPSHLFVDTKLVSLNTLPDVSAVAKY